MSQESLHSHVCPHSSPVVEHLSVGEQLKKVQITHTEVCEIIFFKGMWVGTGDHNMKQKNEDNRCVVSHMEKEEGQESNTEATRPMEGERRKRSERVGNDQDTS